jgi:hypothetical protein
VQTTISAACLCICNSSNLVIIVIA